MSYILYNIIAKRANQIMSNYPFFIVLFQEAYRNWLCSQYVTYYLEGQPIKACLTCCATSSQREPIRIRQTFFLSLSRSRRHILTGFAHNTLRGVLPRGRPNQSMSYILCNIIWKTTNQITSNTRSLSLFRRRIVTGFAHNTWRITSRESQSNHVLHSVIKWHNTARSFVHMGRLK